MTQISSTGQFSAGGQTKRSSGMDVYTGLLLAALVVLLAGFITILMANMNLADGEQPGGGMLDSVPGFQVVSDK